ncbi:beta-Ala-Xaa dipeptidase, partial [Mycobacterium tuberculosis]
MGLMAVGLTAPAFAETIKKPELDRLAASWQGGKPASSFNAFLAQAEKANPALKPAVAAYRKKGKKAPLAGDDLTNIARLLGLYNRLHNQKAVIASL